MKDFTQFLLTKSYSSNFKLVEMYIDQALEMTITDVKYNFELDSEEIINRIKMNYNELAIYLYKLGNLLYENSSKESWQPIHWIMKECCSCEIFFSAKIDIGFYIVHGEGTIIGPRHEIGKGFNIYQGCTVGILNNKQDKVTIGNDVTLYSNSSILGNIRIGNNVKIGSNIIVNKEILSNQIIRESI